MKGPGLRHHEAWAHKLRAEQKRAFLQDGAFRSKIHHRHLLDLLPAPKTRHVPRLAQYRTAKFSRDTIPTCSTTKGPKKKPTSAGTEGCSWPDPPPFLLCATCIARHTTPRAQVMRPQTRRDALSACPWQACGCANTPNINLRRGHMKLGHLAPPALCGPDCSCLTVARHRAFAGARLLVVVEADSQGSAFGTHALRFFHPGTSFRCRGRSADPPRHLPHGLRIREARIRAGGPQTPKGPNSPCMYIQYSTPTARDEPPCSGCGRRSDQQTLPLPIARPLIIVAGA
jgi:hypothetical protein